MNGNLTCYACLMNFTAKSKWLLCCGLLGASSVALGAIASHALPDARAASAVSLAAMYQLLHTVAILALLSFAAKWAAFARLVMLIGIIGFSGAIYAKYLFGLAAIGALAPLGGSLLILSWLIVAAGAFMSAAPRQ